MHKRLPPELTLPLGPHLTQNMGLECLAALDLPGCSAGEALGGGSSGFDLRHLSYLFFASVRH